MRADLYLEDEADFAAAIRDLEQVLRPTPRVTRSHCTPVHH